MDKQGDIGAIVGAAGHIGLWLFWRKEGEGKGGKIKWLERNQK